MLKNNFLLVTTTMIFLTGPVWGMEYQEEGKKTSVHPSLTFQEGSLNPGHPQFLSRIFYGNPELIGSLKGYSTEAKEIYYKHQKTNKDCPEFWIENFSRKQNPEYSALTANGIDRLSTLEKILDGRVLAESPNHPLYHISRRVAPSHKDYSLLIHCDMLHPLYNHNAAAEEEAAKKREQVEAQLNKSAIESEKRLNDSAAAAEKILEQEEEARRKNHREAQRIAREREKKEEQEYQDYLKRKAEMIASETPEQTKAREARAEERKQANERWLNM